MNQTTEAGPENCEERYEAFIDSVVETRELWILVNSEASFLKVYAEDEDFQYLPVWPSAEAAIAYASGDAELSAHAVALPVFLNRWVNGLTQDGLQVGVWPGDDGTVWVLSPEELREELNDALSSAF